ncbi:MAG: nicotinamide-nucleotide amidohydrolase family protein [Gammaproteobacteria bacterium]|nr:nicotinamide-nucleotide amidohydrolase family protein [Gammaproteobacteria bacterium]
MNNIDTVVEFFAQRNLKITTAESFTEGLAASLLKKATGSEAVFEFGYVVYSEHVKHSSLKVYPKNISLLGLGTELTAREMALGALELNNFDMALAITGCAESEDGLEEVMCFAYAFRGKTQISVLSEAVKFSGGHNKIKQAAAEHGIVQLPIYYEKLQTQTTKEGKLSMITEPSWLNRLGL